MKPERLIIWWNTNSHPERWRVDVMRKNSEDQFGIVYNSESVEFPIRVEDFGPLEEDTLIQSLKNAFPGHDISLKF